MNGASPLAPNSCVDVKIEASRIWQAGLAKADLKNGTDTLVPLNAVRYLVPFNVKVEGPTPEVVNVGFTRGRESRIRLRNDDGMAYRFLWRLELAEASHAGEGFVPANGSTTIPVTLASSNFPILKAAFYGAATGRARQSRLSAGRQLQRSAPSSKTISGKRAAELFRRHRAADHELRVGSPGSACRNFHFPARESRLAVAEETSRGQIAARRPGRPPGWAWRCDRHSNSQLVACRKETPA